MNDTTTMDTFTEMFQAFIAHMNSGHQCFISHWHGIHREQFGVVFEDTLVSPRVEDVLCIYVCGTFQCSCCKKVTCMDTTQMPALNAQTNQLLCRGCVMPVHGTLGIKYLQIRMPTSLELPSSPYHIYTDERPKTDEEKTLRWMHYEGVCKGVAHAHEMTYLGGKNMANVRADFRAKRVIKKWRNVIKRRYAARMFQVLYHCCDLGKDASLTLSKRAIFG